mmetsp:Transcript_10271/g.24662  ORF Transcript_10271/g.24662 Transcript_10271/m.24662 type:complete len:318 (+) Transcript_10271:118-1071(+)
MVKNKDSNKVVGTGSSSPSSSTSDGLGAVVPSAQSLMMKIEMPMADLTLVMTIISLIWKSRIGLGWLPFGIGTAFDRIMAGPREGGSSGSSSIGGDFDGGFDNNRPAQYPRRVGGNNNNDEQFWVWVYFCMYGILGFFAQYGGRKLSQDQPLVRWSLLYGTFHIVLAGHHLMWSLSGWWYGGQQSTYGKLELWRYDLPGLYPVTALASFIMMLQAGRIISMALVSSSSSRGRRGSKGRLAYMHLTKIRQIKTVLDLCSVWTLFSFIFFWIFNIIGFDPPMIVDRVLWALTMYPLPFIASTGFLSVSTIKVKKQVFPA